MKRLVAIDCDGVLGDFVSAASHVSRSPKVIYPIEKMFGSDDRMWRVIEGAGQTFHAMLKPYNNAREALELLRTKYRIVCVTSQPKSCINWTHYRARWLEKHLDIQRDELVFTANKSLIAASVLIDDLTKNVATFPGKSMLVRRPWNQDDELPIGCEVVAGFSEAVDRLLSPDFWT